jgi:hypothetical protein
MTTKPTPHELKIVSQEVNEPILSFENWASSGSKNSATIGCYLNGKYYCMGFITVRRDKRGVELF